MIDKNIEYGVSYKNRFGWDCKVYGPFASEEEAQKWLNHQEGDFRTRELVSKTKAIEMAGESEFDDATINKNYYEWLESLQ